MAIELKIPEVGESVTEVQISEWLKSEGDEIKADEAVAVIDSEKTTFDLPAPKGGRLIKILHPAGDTVKVGEVIAHIDADSKAAAGKPVEAKGSAKPKSEPKAEAKSETSPTEKPDKEDKTVERKPKENGTPAETKAKAPEARAKDGPAREETPKEQEIAPEPDAETQAPSPSPPKAAATTTPPQDGEEEVVPMTMLRRTVARRLVEARQQMAMLTTFNEVDMSAVQTLRHEHKDAFEKRHEVKLGLMSFFVKAAVDALKQFPQLNAEVRGNDIVYRNFFNIGVALATGRGLVVPVLHHAERLSFADVEKAIGGFAQRAIDATLKPDELAGATFTITNGGVFGSLLSTPIINPPQSGIMGMHTIQERPVVVEGQVVIRPMMYLALTYDHRIVDGREAVLFLRRIKEAIETPARMLLEI